MLAHERGDLRRREPVGGRVRRDVARRRRLLARSARGTATRKRLRPWYLPCSISRVPARYLRSSHGWLKNVAFMIPVASATVASTSGFIPRRRTGRDVIERTSTTTVATSSGPSSAIVRASERSRGRCSSRSPTVCSPSRSAPFAAGAGDSSSGAASSDGRGHRGPPSARSSAALSGADDANASGGESTAPMMAGGGQPGPCATARRRDGGYCRRRRYSAAISHQ